MIKTFTELVKIYSPSKKEGKIAKVLVKKLKNLGCKVYVDNAGKKIGGETGNIIAKFPGTVKSKPLLLVAHMDTVEPCKNIKPIIKKDRITSDGKTILGADCKASIATILEILQTLKETKTPHPPMEVLLSVCEETGLLGSKNLDYSKVKSKYGLLLDNCFTDTVCMQCAGRYSIDIKVKGVPVHAALEPEKGISALEVAAKLINSIKIGRIDKQTVCNLAVIEGGTTTNVLTPEVKIKGETRSLNMGKLKKQIKNIKSVCRRIEKASSKKVDGKTIKAKIKVKFDKSYIPLDISKNTPIFKELLKSARKQNIKLKTLAITAGCDANILYEKAGIAAPVIDCGARKIHSTKEYLDLKEFFKCTRLVYDTVVNFKT
jgi:tripeptide aminopeptidase